MIPHDPPAVAAPPVWFEGRVESCGSGLVTVRVPLPRTGDVYRVERGRGGPYLAAVVSCSHGSAVLAPFDDPTGTGPGDRVTGEGAAMTVTTAVDDGVFDCFGRPLDPGAVRRPALGTPRPVYAPPPPPLSRPPVSARFVTGLRAVDALFPLGAGQRLAVVAGAGVGKSTLLADIARGAEVDVVVTALVGERGREVVEFVDQIRRPGRPVVTIAATSDEPAARRALAPFTATAVAEAFRDRGLSVLLLVDSLTRFARAVREIDVAAGESPVRGGLTTGVYERLPKLLERAGTAEGGGTITAFYSLLVPSDDEPDPLAEEVKSLTDGHLVLTAARFRAGYRPALDPLRSLSRMAGRFPHPVTDRAREMILRHAHRLERDRDALLFGGTPDPELAEAANAEPAVRRFLTQGGGRGSGEDRRSGVEETAAAAAALLAECRQGVGGG